MSVYGEDGCGQAELDRHPQAPGRSPEAATCTSSIPLLRSSDFVHKSTVMAASLHRMFAFSLSLSILIQVGALSADDSPAANPERKQMELWWIDLAQHEPVASQALLKFAFKFEKSIPFLKEKMKPFKIDAAEVRVLLKKLESDDEAVWKPAYEDLQYFDPRLAIELEPLMKEVGQRQARGRLTAILSGDRKPESLEGKDITLRPLGNGEGYNFFDGQGSWWAEHLVERLNASHWGNKKMMWTRALRAINLLDQIGSADALAILTTMTTGHPDAEPTRVAKERLAARQGKKP